MMMCSESSGYGLVASRELQANEEVLTVASECLLTMTHRAIASCAIWNDFTEQVCGDGGWIDDAKRRKKSVVLMIDDDDSATMQKIQNSLKQQDFFEKDAEIINLAVLLLLEKLKGDDSFFK